MPGSNKSQNSKKAAGFALALEKQRLPEMMENLGNWYRQNHRRLPFRSKVHWYTTLVSEVMLQQTRIAAMLPAYERFLTMFPNVRALADAPQEDVLHAWAGLGYYSRARNLQKAARQIVELHEGEFPVDRKEALGLAGVGPYTASAVRSIALGYPDPVVDGNVIRVLSRWFYDSTANSSPSDSGEAKESPAQYRSPSKRPDRERAPGAFSTRLTIRESTLERTVQKCAEILMENSVLDPSTHNQSLMELGAMICTPGLPSCAVCPVQNHCYAFLSGGPALASDIPAVKKARRQDLDLTLYWVHSVRGVLLIRNPERPILRQDWLLPCKIESLDLPVYIDEVPGVFSMQKEGLLQAVPIRKSSRPSGQPSVKGKPGSTRDAREGTKPGSSRVREFSHSIMNYRIRARVHRIALEAATFESSQNPIVAPDRCAEDSDPKRQFLWVPEKEVHRYCPSSLIKKAVQRIDGDF